MFCDDSTEHSRSSELLTGARQRGPVVVTGAAGFIGSHLVDGLLARGRQVVGLDCFDRWYDPATKWSNLGAALLDRRFRLHQIDLATHPSADLAHRLRGAEVVYHLAGRAGVQDSWGDGFAAGCRSNILAAQRVLEASLAAGVGRVILASSSSVYGEGGVDRGGAPAPISPYGVSKLAAEQLGRVYGARGLPVVTLRYFTVFGPRQRPDMAFNRVLGACLGGPSFPRRGTGRQVREFTYVGDVVEATMAAGELALDRVVGRPLDIGGGTAVSVNQVIDVVSAITGRRPPVTSRPGSPGDPTATAADLAPTTAVLGWRPSTRLEDGLSRQWAWQRHRADHDGGGPEVALGLLVDGAAG